jgi:hypothetical protein
MNIHTITLGASTQITYFLNVEIFKKIFFFKEQLFVKKNEESFQILCNILFSKWNIQHYLITQ